MQAVAIHHRLLFAPLLFCGVIFACSGEEKKRLEAADPSISPPVEVFSWWQRHGEVDVLGALLEAHAARHPRDDILKANANASREARDTLTARLLKGEPPDAFQANIGHDMMQWARANRGTPVESKLRKLSDLAEMRELLQALPPPVAKEIQAEGSPYCVPAMVHRENELFVNVDLLERLGYQVPSSLDELLQLGEGLRQNDVSLLALGTEDPWPLSLLVLQSLVISMHGSQFYEDYFHGKLRPDDPRMLATLSFALRLLAYVNQDHAQLNWEQASDLVAQGKAAMIAMGDWAKAPLYGEDEALGASIREIAFVGSQSTFVYTTDTFALPLGAKNEAGALRFLGTIASKQGQQAISRSTSSISPRLDVRASSSDPALAQKQELWTSGHLVLALSGLLPPSLFAELSQALSDMLQEGRISPVVYTLRARYHLLGRP